MQGLYSDYDVDLYPLCEECGKKCAVRGVWCVACEARIRKTDLSNKKHTARRVRLLQRARSGWTVEAFKAAEILQRGMCALCSGHMLKVCADHCHVTGKARALLCHPCNASLGFYEKRQSLAGLVILPYDTYLEKYRS